MHFDIICLEDINTPKEDWCDYIDSTDDWVYEENTDYIGEIRDEEYRKAIISSKWFADLVKPYAIVDTEKETITFLDRETIRKNFSDYLVWITEKLHDIALSGKLSGYELRNAGTNICTDIIHGDNHDLFDDNPTLFHKDDYGHTSFGFFEDAQYEAGKTYRIGNIFDAHI